MKNTLFFAPVLLVLACGEQVVVRETEASCGNGKVEMGELCDDGNLEHTDSCTGSCQPAQCGDGVQRQDLCPEDPGYEECDDGNTNWQDGCVEGCRVADCGDGFLQGGPRGGKR